MATVILDRREAGARWLDRDLARLLTPLVPLYALGRGLDALLRPRRALPAQPPSLAIGNLRVGGSGKTPVVADLGTRLAAQGLRVSVLARGYRAGEAGDEPDWLRGHGLAVELGSDRLRSFERARAAGAELVLLDDALQSRVQASCTAALVLEEDLERPPRLLPAGPAREGPGALARVQFLFVRSEGEAWPPPTPKRPAALHDDASIHAFRLTPAALEALEGSAPSLPSGAVALLSGLARPQSFERDAARFGIEAAVSLRLSDHARLGVEERAAIEACRQRFELRSVVLPEKNQRRFAPYLRSLGLEIYVLRARVEWSEDPLPRIRAALSLPSKK